MSEQPEHVCEETDPDWVVCVAGQIFGPCEYENCGGSCQHFYACECPCHDPKKETS